MPVAAAFSPSISGSAFMIGPERDITSAFLLVYAGLFPLINPLGAAPVFLSLTRDMGGTDRNKLALAVAVNSFILLLGAMLFGSYVLQFFGITISAVRVAGGALVAFMGWNLLNGSDSTNTESPEIGPSRTVNDGFYPLTLPLTVGPGSISVALTLGAHHASAANKSHFLLVLCSALLGLVALALTIYVTYRFASRLVRWLGSSGVNVLVRLSAFILVCIGVQIAWGGLAELIAGLQEASLPNFQGPVRVAL
jgi:multiple antibiotic resistance protein